MFEPLRFLHVADAALDLPLCELGAISESWQQLAEDATLMAFDQMIAGAISQQVDCVLLAGSTFCEQDQSLRARLTLRAGFEDLHEQGISVFVLPGPHDPESAWRNIPNLPGNVTLLTTGKANDEESQIPVAIMRDGRVIATITTGSLSQLSAEAGRDVNLELNPESISAPAAAQNGLVRSAPFRIGMLTAWPMESFEGDDLSRCLSACGCDYLAVPQSDPLDRQRGWHFAAGQTLNTQDGIAHHPGRLQALSAQETGPHGATLIEVDETGEIRGTFLPFACARRLRFDVPVVPTAALEDIAEAMSRQLAEETEQPGEQAWFANWILRGRGESFAPLQDPELQSQLIDLLPGTRGPNGAIAIHHRLQFQESSAPSVDEDALSDLEHLYRKALDNFSVDAPAFVEFLSEAALSEIARLDDPAWRERLKPLIAEWDPEAVLIKAHSLGSEWFREEMES